MRVTVILSVIAGLALGIAAFALDTTGAATGWLIVWLVCLGPCIGAVSVGLTGRLAWGPWYDKIAAPTRLLLLLTPLIALGAVPVLLNPDALYPWTGDPAAMKEMVRHKLGWLNPPFFIARVVIELAVISAAAWAIAAGRLIVKPVAGLTAIAYVLAASFFAFDISMSLDPEFNSSIFGLYVLAGQSAGGLGLILSLHALRADTHQPLHGRLAWLLFGACALWGYHAFMQYLVVWSGDIPRLAHWYLDRNQGGWLILFIAVCALFTAPALYLAPPVRHARAAALAAFAVTLGAALETIWRVAPGLAPDPASGVAGLAVVLLAGGAALWALERMQREAPHG